MKIRVCLLLLALCVSSTVVAGGQGAIGITGGAVKFEGLDRSSSYGLVGRYTWPLGDKWFIGGQLVVRKETTTFDLETPEVIPDAFEVTSSVDAMLRVGYTARRWSPYAGLGVTEARTDLLSENGKHRGWKAALGFDHYPAHLRNAVFFAQVEYADYDDETYTFLGRAGSPVEFPLPGFEGHTVQIGFLYVF